MAYRLLRRDTTNPWVGVNHKRIQRRRREEGLRRPVRTRKRRRTRTEDSGVRVRPHVSLRVRPDV